VHIHLKKKLYLLNNQKEKRKIQERLIKKVAPKQSSQYIIDCHYDQPKNQACLENISKIPEPKHQMVDHKNGIRLLIFIRKGKVALYQMGSEQMC